MTSQGEKDQRMLTDYHTHTPLCLHAEGNPVDYARHAREIDPQPHLAMAADDLLDVASDLLRKLVVGIALEARERVAERVPERVAIADPEMRQRVSARV